MTIVAYGYGLSGLSAVGGADNLSISVDDEPDIFLDPDITVTLEADDINIAVDPDIDIEVE